MYVKILQRQNKKTEIFEVDSVSVYVDPTDPTKFIIDSRKGTEQKAILVSAGGSEIYLLNAQGQTIDSFRP